MEYSIPYTPVILGIPAQVPLTIDNQHDLLSSPLRNDTVSGPTTVIEVLHFISCNKISDLLAEFT